ncbi:Nucleotide-binding universal stress protein, UspA family [Ruegeria halocynthiae]|uniref:Nucleotide-binding universal stress protein, UspA family n=1 Tax=Ruegeria halocynthiae TaxID=985054 RepID=A0A1H3CS98_9RHOB|nr:universal stress protein [Ruegeria halocynthiae]SDX57023.1 Nucleotide-binding universal stress protein, UspA family [Ruegeria halocynthiae]
MFRHIMVPIDLHMPPEVKKAIEVAAQLAEWQGAKVTIVSVTGSQPGDTHMTSEAIEREMKTCAREIAKQSGRQVDTRNIYSVDVAVEIDKNLTRTAEEIGADLIVVGTHAPRITDYIFSSHAEYLAKHTTMSVFVVR